MAKRTRIGGRSAPGGCNRGLGRVAEIAAHEEFADRAVAEEAVVRAPLLDIVERWLEGSVGGDGAAAVLELERGGRLGIEHLLDGLEDLFGAVADVLVAV